MARPKIPKQNQPSAIPKHVPRPKQFQPTVGDGYLRVRFNSVDLEGRWCMGSIDSGHFRDLLERLRSFESMKCADVFARGSEIGKTYTVSKLPAKEARDRLVDLEYDDQTEIARLRISGKRRLYGFLPDGGPDFYVLWWDPEHEIWPSNRE